MSKYTNQEKSQIQTIVADLSIKRTPDPVIMKHVLNQTGKRISRKTLWNVRQRLKKDSYHWYKTLREGQFEYLHEFKERINEIIDLQQQHHQIILEKQKNPSIVQTSLAELHKLNITLSNYYDIAPYIVPNLRADLVSKDNDSISTKTEDKKQDIIV